METNFLEKTMMDCYLNTASHNLKEVEEAGRNGGSIWFVKHSGAWDTLRQTVNEDVFLIVCRTFQDSWWTQGAQILVDASEVAETGLVMFVQRAGLENNNNSLDLTLSDFHGLRSVKWIYS